LGGWVIVSFVCSGIHLFACLPVVTVVPHKAVAEVSKTGNYRRGEFDFYTSFDVENIYITIWSKRPYERLCDMNEI
jgi:hypothetical protein